MGLGVKEEVLLGDAPCLGVHSDDREAHLLGPAVHDGTHGVWQLDGRLIVYSLGQRDMVRPSATAILPPTHSPLHPWPPLSGSTLLGGRSWGPSPALCLLGCPVLDEPRASQPLVHSTLIISKFMWPPIL